MPFGQATEKSDMNLIFEYQCRFDKHPNASEIIIPSETYSMLGQYNINSFNEKVVKSAKPCILDLLNLKYCIS